MRESSYGKVFKGALVTTLAAGALVAVAPVNTEAAPTFTDVSDIPSHYFYDAVVKYTEMGAMSVYPDGKFKPGESITRQDAAKLLAIVLDLDLNNVKDPGFKDISKTDPNFKYIAALVEAKVISGYEDKTFKPSNTLTRSQMSKILVLGFKLKHNENTKLPFKDMNDKIWYANYVKALYTNEITLGITATTFAPDGLVTRGQMASFVLRSEKSVGSKQDDVEKATVTAAAEQVVAGAVTVSKGNQAPDATKLAAVQTYVDKLITNKDVKATVAAASTAGNFVVTLTKGEAKISKTIAMTFNYTSDDRFVTDVKAINAKQIEVKFSTPVSRNSVLNSANEVQNVFFTMVSGSTVDPGKLKGSLSEDGKTLLITANWIFDGEYVFKATTAIQATAGGKLEEHTVIVKANDKQAPKIVTGSAVGKVSTNAFSVRFDEPVSSTGVIAYVDGILATVSSNHSDPNRLDLTSSKQIAAGATVTVKLQNVKDYNQNLLSPNPSETAITVSTDTVAPTVTKVTVLGENKVEVVFDKAMDIASFRGKARLVYSTGDVTQLSATVGSNANTVILTGERAPSALNNANVILFMDENIKDTVGNSTALYSTNIVVNKDTVPPAMIGADYKDGKIVMTFSEDISIGRSSSLTVIDQQTGTPKPVTVTATNHTIVGNTLTIPAYLANGTYQLQLPAYTVTDQSVSKNPNAIGIQYFTVVNNFANDTIRPFVHSIKSEPAQKPGYQTISYVATDNESGIDLLSVQRLANYTLDGQGIPADSLVTTEIISPIKPTSVKVFVHIPTEKIQTTGLATFAILDIRDNADNTLVTTISERVMLAGYAQNPRLNYGAIEGNGTSISLTFSEAIRSLDNQDIIIRLNGTQVQPNYISITPTNSSSKYSATIFASVASDDRGTFTYIDNDNNRIFTSGDIKIQYGNYSNTNVLVPVPFNNVFHTVTVQLVRDAISPVESIYGVPAIFGNEVLVK